MLRPLLFRSRGGLRCSSCRGMIFQPSRSSSSSGNGNANGKGSPASLEPKKVTVPHLLRVAREGQRKLSVVTAYDYPSAAHVCRAGVDVLLVGDSLGMVVRGKGARPRARLCPDIFGSVPAPIPYRCSDMTPHNQSL
jgi:hypothetical protein